MSRDDDDLYDIDANALMDEAIGGYQDVDQILRRSDTTTVDERDAVLPQISNFQRPSIVHDELEDRAAAMDKAAIGPNGEAVDEIYQIARMRLQERKLSDPAAAAMINPPSAFSGSGANLAGQAKLTPTSTQVLSAVQQNVVYWQGTNEEVGPVTITLQLQDVLIGSILGSAPGSGSGSFTGLQTPIKPFAIIHWGAFGQLFQAEIDVGRGVQFTINCSSVAIDLGLDSYPNQQYPAPSPVPTAVVQAALAFKNIGRPNSLIRTRYGMGDSGVLTPTNSKNIYVPEFSAALLPVQMSSLTGSVQLDFKDATDTIIYSLKYNNGAQTNPIPIATDVSQVLVTNTGGTNQTFRLPFQLAL